jgi:hypothetical protein
MFSALMMAAWCGHAHRMSKRYTNTISSTSAVTEFRRRRAEATAASNFARAESEIMPRSRNWRASGRIR